MSDECFVPKPCPSIVFQYDLIDPSIVTKVSVYIDRDRVYELPILTNAERVQWMEAIEHDRMQMEEYVQITRNYIKELKSLNADLDKLLHEQTIEKRLARLEAIVEGKWAITNGTH